MATSINAGAILTSTSTGVLTCANVRAHDSQYSNKRGHEPSVKCFLLSVFVDLVKRKTQLQSFPTCLALALPQSYQAGLDLYIPRCLRCHSPTRNRLTRTCASLCHKYIPQTEKRRTPCMIIQRKYNDPHEKHTFQTNTTWQQKSLKKRNLHDDSMIQHPETFQTHRQIMDCLMPPSQEEPDLIDQQIPLFCFTKVHFCYCIDHDDHIHNQSHTGYHESHGNLRAGDIQILTNTHKVTWAPKDFIEQEKSICAIYIYNYIIYCIEAYRCILWLLNDRFLDDQAVPIWIHTGPRNSCILHWQCNVHVGCILGQDFGKVRR